MIRALLVTVVMSLIAVTVEGQATTRSLETAGVSLRLYQPAEIAPGEQLCPVVLELSNQSASEMNIAGRNLAQEKGHFDPAHFPAGWSLHLVVERHGSTGPSTGSLRLPPDQDYLIKPRDSGLIKGYVPHFILGGRDNLLRAVLVLDGKEVASSAPLVVHAWR